jgi:thiosulfate/3-mercaptopyruvate sulfurtransferase
LRNYACPDVLVSTDWVRQKLDDPRVRTIEVDVDTTQYEVGHIPGSVALHWRHHLHHPVNRDILSREAFERLMSSLGISETDTVVLYGDNHNWFAAHAFWIMKYFGHGDVRIMNGGRNKWLSEADKPLTSANPHLTPRPYSVREIHPHLRAKLPDVLEATMTGSTNLFDVRCQDEYAGRLIAPPGLVESSQRGGHIPGAVNIPWSRCVNADSTFRSREDLEAIFWRSETMDQSLPTICYCRIGERSSHTWFVLTHLLGQRNCRNYDGSWTEYGNLIGVPIATGPEPRGTRG